MKKKYSIILAIVIVLSLGVFMSSKKTYVNTLLENNSMLANSAWEMVQYSTPTQSTSIRGTDWFIHFGKDSTGYVKLCETYPFTYIQENETHIVLSFDVENKESTTCQDSDGIQKFLLGVLEKSLVLEHKNTASDISSVLIISDGQNKIALVPRAMEHLPTHAFSNTFFKKEQSIEIHPTFSCKDNTLCGEVLDSTLFPITISGVDEAGKNIADKKLTIQGTHISNTTLPVGTYTITPGIALQQSFNFEPLIFSITSAQEDLYTIPLTITIE